MSNAKNNDAAKTTAKSDTSVEEVASIVEGIVPAQNGSKPVAEAEKNVIVDETEIVDEPSLFQKAKSVFMRNRKMIFAVAGVIVVGVLVKIAKSAELEDEVEVSDSTDSESDVADETLAV